MLNKKQYKEYKAFEESLKKISEADIAWFSGWLCADGSIGCVAGNSPHIKFTLTDRDPLDKFSELFGGAVNGPYAPSGLGIKHTYTWKIKGSKTQPLLKRCLPWLSERYLERAMEALTFKLTDGRRVLSISDVVSIKNKLKNHKHGDCTKLANQYGVSVSLISGIKTGRFWPDYAEVERKEMLCLT